METTLRFRSFDGTPLEGTYAASDARSDAVVILVHGITSSRDEFGLFSGLAGHLAKEGVPSFRFDYRCHGQSDRPMEKMTLSGIVNDLESAAVLGLAQAGASRTHVVGMSFGGGLSAFWAATTEVAVSSVVMLAPVIDYREDVLGQHGAIVDDKLSNDATELLRDEGFVEMDGIHYGPALLNELRFISGVEGLRRLKCDSLIIHGDADSIVPYASSERFVTLNDRCQLVNIPGTDHGFGVGDDEDLSSPETKEKHREVFGIISQFLQKTAHA
ncbi:MAG: alpha/beta fold hydrolase [Planctomycetes bacterium]|nr:alpha/beta fold hydrolase [Planctomycetota bacterium]